MGCIARVRQRKGYYSVSEEQALKLMAILTAAYPNTQISKATVDVYINFLLPLDYDAAQKAVFSLISKSQFFPTIAEIKAAADSFSPKAYIPDPDQAWLEVMTQIQSVGSYGIPKFSHQAIKDAVDVIGWWNLCASENIGVERAHFMRVYEAVKKRNEEQQLNLQVVSILEYQERKALGDGRY